MKSIHEDVSDLQPIEVRLLDQLPLARVNVPKSCWPLFPSLRERRLIRRK